MTRHPISGVKQTVDNKNATQEKERERNQKLSGVFCFTENGKELTMVSSETGLFFKRAASQCFVPNINSIGPKTTKLIVSIINRKLEAISDNESAYCHNHSHTQNKKKNSG